MQIVKSKFMSVRDKFRNMSKQEKIVFTIFALAVIGFVVLMVVNPAFATANNYTSRIRTIMTNMVKIVGTIFQAVGVILTVYAVGQLILAFKNEDANSKSTASTLMVVGIVLIALPSIINTLNIINLIGA